MSLQLPRNEASCAKLSIALRSCQKQVLGQIHGLALWRTADAWCPRLWQKTEDLSVSGPNRRCLRRKEVQRALLNSLKHGNASERKL